VKVIKTEMREEARMEEIGKITEIGTIQYSKQRRKLPYIAHSTWESLGL
jgi:hypothetical protein